MYSSYINWLKNDGPTTRNFDDDNISIKNSKNLDKKYGSYKVSPENGRTKSKMPTKYKLIYFNMMGRAELARLIFAAAGVDYEDYRFEKEEWPEVKSKLSTGFGTVPVLEVPVDGTDCIQISQSFALSRFLARKYGLCGETDLEAAQVDELVDTLDDLIKPVHAFYNEENKEKKMQMIEKYIEGTMKKYLEMFEARCSKCLSKGFLVGNKLTWGDLQFINTMSWIDVLAPTMLSHCYPNITEIKKSIESLPRIADWLDKRPVTAS